MDKIAKDIINDIVDTPFDFSLKITYTNKGILSIDFIEKCCSFFENHKFSYIRERIIRYLHGEMVNFTDIPYLINANTTFAIKVLTECKKIPYGKTITYKELSKKAGNPKAFRAVGNILGKNRLPIIIPCHRVIGSDGKLHGFTGGIHIKETLLKLEKSFIV
jgi:O-6-methylguanine DNA methyltransferase